MRVESPLATKGYILTGAGGGAAAAGAAAAAAAAVPLCVFFVYDSLRDHDTIHLRQQVCCNTIVGSASVIFSLRFLFLRGSSCCKMPAGATVVCFIIHACCNIFCCNAACTDLLATFLANGQLSEASLKCPCCRRHWQSLLLRQLPLQ